MTFCTFFIHLFLFSLWKYFCLTTNQPDNVYYVGVILFLLEAPYRMYEYFDAKGWIK